jgi:hypothetical protein
VRDRRQRQRQRPRAAALPVLQTKTLCIVLGIPASLVGEIEGWVASAFGHPTRVLAIPATDDDNRPYNQAQIRQVFQSAVEYAQRKRRAEQQPAPANILLLYVPGRTDEPAIAPFDFFVFPVPLQTLSSFENGRQLRHDRAHVKSAIESALVPASEALQRLKIVEERVGAVRDEEALQLPPGNFFLDRATTIATVFRALRRGERPWDDPVDELVAEEFDDERIPHLKKNVRRRAYKDARGLVFLRADLNELHGPNRELPDQHAVEERADLLLRGSFRFGSPLLSGFHHDVQLENDRALSNLDFNCAQKGKTGSKALYINIYPNDTVRGRKLAAL